MKDSLLALLRDTLSSLRDLLPIVLVIGIFQIFVIKAPVSGLISLLIGGLLVVLGLTFFIFGLRLSLFPIGESLAHSLAKKGSLFCEAAGAAALAAEEEAAGSKDQAK